jgi:hypothetical protein
VRAQLLSLDSTNVMTLSRSCEGRPGGQCEGREFIHQIEAIANFHSARMESPRSLGESGCNIDAYQIGDRGYKFDKCSSFWHKFDRSDYFKIAPSDKY